MEQLRALPKIELHLHLDCSLSYRAVSALAPSVTPTTLTAEYQRLQQVFNWTDQDFLRANLMGLDAAFANDEVKQQLRKRFLKAYEGAITAE